MKKYIYFYVCNVCTFLHIILYRNLKKMAMKAKLIKLRVGIVLKIINYKCGNEEIHGI